MKDNFSGHSSEYARFRPGYPQDFYTFLKEQLSGNEAAWDCGTGNGQVAVEIAEFFSHVAATDISENQMVNAVKKPNITYSVQPAEKTDFSNGQFDLVICAQAVHWFNFKKFYAEARRCLKPWGIIAIIGYGLFKSSTEINRIIHRFYNEIIGPYWDAERRYLDEAYKTIPFPFNEIKTPEFSQEYQWSIEHLLGYLRTWSAVKHYEKKNHIDPVSLIEEELRISFGEKNRVVFPILCRMGKITEADQ